jgi:uncharacterized protein (DUF433 family)
MALAVDIDALIEQSPEIRGNRPCIAGTGVSNMRIANYHNLGFTPAEIAVKCGHLTLAQVHAALAYYVANEDEVDQDIESEEAAGATNEGRL